MTRTIWFVQFCQDPYAIKHTMGEYWFSATAHCWLSGIHFVGKNAVAIAAPAVDQPIQPS
jgi:hypothetical protein